MVLKKHEKSGDTNLLVLQNTTSGIFFTIHSGMIPWESLLLDEIDALKIFGCSISREHFVQLKNPTNVKQNKVKPIKKAVKNYLLKIDTYVTFLEGKFDGICQENIKKLHSQFLTLRNKLFESTVRIHAQDLSSLLENVNHLRLDFPEGTPFNTFQELFHSEMLLLYAMENGVILNDFNFAAFKQQNPLNICLYSDMCFHCEMLLAWFVNTTDRAGKKLIVSSINPSTHPTRLPNAQFLQHIFLPPFIKVALQEAELQR
jgi:hypothetical protein